MCAVWSESSLNEFWIIDDVRFIHAENEDWSDCADEFAGRCHAEGMFSHVAGHIIGAAQAQHLSWSTINHINLSPRTL